MLRDVQRVVTRWSMTRLTTRTRPASCYQVVDDTFDHKYVDLWNPNTNMSEDCLYLNIWRPATGGTNKSVMVWIYGGGFSSGSSTLDIYDGSILATKGDVIVVSMQYRVGPLGFLALGGTLTGASGNAGLLDQQMALRWVHDHIAAFGGNPQRVTLFGESAGSASVSLHLLSSGSEELFRSAILMSAAVPNDWNYVNRASAAKTARAIAKLANCNVSMSDKSVVDCLRRVSALKLTKYQLSVDAPGPKMTGPFRPTVDGRFIAGEPAELLRTGKFQKKDILVGAVRNEGIYFLLYMYPKLFNISKSSITLSDDEYRSTIRNMRLLKSSNDFVVNSVAFEYARPCGDAKASWSNNNAAALDQLVGDASFVCPVVNFARTYAEKTNNSVYVYSFNHRTSGNPWPTWTGVAHGYELDHLFGVPWHHQNKSKYTDEERTLSSNVITYWTNFAKAGDPNQGQGGAVNKPQVWPAYTINNRTVLVLDTGNKLTTQTGLRERECDYWLNVVVPYEAHGAGFKVQAIDQLWIVLACLVVKFVCQ